MKYKGVLAGVLLTLLIGLIFVTIGSASNVLETIAVDFYTVKKIVIDNVDRTPPSDQVPFVYNGRTYVPLRYVADALGKSVNWDGATGTIYIGDSPNQIKTNTIYDDFSGPLSLNWDVANQRGNWSIDQNKGAFGRNQTYCQPSLLPLDRNKHYISDKYIIEAEIAFTSRGYAGIFLKDNMNDSYLPYRINLVKNNLVISEYNRDEHVIPQDLIEEEYYKLKINVNGNTVDIYIDDNFIFSDVIHEELGDDIGLVSGTASDGGYIKNFKIIAY